MKLDYKGHKIDLKIRKGNGHIKLWYCRIDSGHAFSAYGIDQPAAIQIDRAKQLIDAQEARSTHLYTRRCENTETGLTKN